MRLMCLFWPDDRPDDHIVEVELDSGRTVAFLKKLIKDSDEDVHASASCSPARQLPLGEFNFWYVLFFSFYLNLLYINLFFSGLLCW